MSRVTSSILTALVLSLALLHLGGVVDLEREATAFGDGFLDRATADRSPRLDPGTDTPRVDDATGSVDAVLLEGLVHEAVNDRRATRGLSPLGDDPALAEIARYHSRDMAQNDYFAHTAPDGETVGDRYDAFGYDCHIRTGSLTYANGGENIYYTSFVGTAYTEHELAERAVDGWMDSPSHRENLLRPYWNDEGIGVWVLQEGGRTHVYVTQNFC
ncbi:CAP domain-containing protein [Haloarchaeobius sp. DT45]|uniref:CAP domain-containing protein n=1 Tax=Haloarchaeobius sp. DT45 TaxID=3446116 RepID=UPI003F6D8D62